MQLIDKIKQVYPELNDAAFMTTIRLQNDSDGRGDYIKSWNYPEPQPTQEELAALE